MRLAHLLVPLTLLAACGDNTEPALEPDAQTIVCTPPAAELPTSGPFASPDALPLPADCVAGGLRDLPGRWFIADLTRLFTFAYPRFEGSCDAGFHQFGEPADDPDVSDGFAHHTWSDGTRYYARTYYKFGASFEYVVARTACVRPDGTLAVTGGFYTSDQGELVYTEQGRRFGVKDEPARGLTRLGGLARWGALGDRAIVGYNVVVDGGVAFVVGPEGLDLIRVTDSVNPTHLGHVGGGQEDGFNDVRVVRGAGRVVAFCSALQDNITAVIDVTDPAAPVRLADLPEYSHSVFVRADGNRTLLYLATYTNAVPVYDVTNPRQPTRLGAAVVPGEEAGIHDLHAVGDLIYANNTTAGLVAIDVSAGLDQPAIERGRIATTYSHASWAATIGGRQIVIHGDEGMTPEGGAFMRILDGDPASPTFLTELARWGTRPEVGIHNMQIVGTKAYVSHYQDGIRIVELADPTHPVEIAHYNTWDEATAPGDAFEGAVGVRPGANGLVYVADIAQGLIILQETP